jgi:ketosteroid isomerase-like protein
MTTNAERAKILERALRARVDGDRDGTEQLYTDDVKAWTPAFSTSSQTELIAEFDRTDDAFSDVALDVTMLDVGGDFACAEWTLTMATPGDTTGARSTVHGITIAEFQDDHICSLRQYWDERAVADLLGADQPESDG